MDVLKGIEPERVFHFFEEISRIPHGSGNTGAISGYLKAFAGEPGKRKNPISCRRIWTWWR